MTKPTVVHDTVELRRHLKAKPARVFRAWKDEAEFAAWNVPGDESWRVKSLEHDFRVGGRRLCTFGRDGSPQFSEDCRYEDIVENERICYSMTISRDRTRITCSIVTVECLAEGQGTELVLTDQIAILDAAETPDDRRRGWGESLDKLVRAIAHEPVA
jgi:uncharacterized protein YndB with AHSA1/START domain